jgi:hypothetical protein
MLLRNLTEKDVKRGCIILPEKHNHLVTDKGLHEFGDENNRIIPEKFKSTCPNLFAETGRGRLQNANGQFLQGAHFLDDLEFGGPNQKC